ncbi:MAG: outer membrane beta-barrel protein [Deltaproteobacteria bacterium]|nr:outer membrane beta-barrel protein [Deltaproteobacteria bacterium]MBN2673476.1 outer membrane beta-barrel protein [Deltaproteobacteria bacterium]
MKKKYLPILVVALLPLLVANQAAAELKMGAGAKFAWDNYKTAIMDYNTQTEATIGSMSYASPRFGGNFQLKISDQFVLSIIADFGFFKHTIYPYPETNSDAAYESEHKFFKFGIGVDGKFYLKKPVDKRAVPYLSLGLGKYFAKASATPDTDDAGNTLIKTELEIISKLSSPFYIGFAFGAEYVVNESFSFGADIFGLRMELAKVDSGMGYPGDMMTGEQSYLNLYMYTALTVNFTFLKDSGAAAPAGNVWGTGGQQQDTGWGGTGTGSATGGWGTPAPAPQPAPQPANNWGTPAPAPAPQPAVVPAPAPAPQPMQPAPEKKKPAFGGGGGASVAPPPPPAP